MRDAFERSLCDRASAHASADTFEAALSPGEVASLRERGWVPSAFYANARSVVHPLACRVRWVDPDTGQATPDLDPAIGLVCVTTRGVEARVRPTPSAPLLLCERHRHARSGAGDFISLPRRGDKIEIEGAFRHEVHLAIVRAVCAAEGRIAFDALRDLLASMGDPYFLAGDVSEHPSAFGWRVRELVDAGWLLARVKFVGSGDSTIEGDVALSPAFLMVFGGLYPYWTVKIPWEERPHLRTAWHPTEREGPFSTLSSGAFSSREEAEIWCREKLGDTAYRIEHVPLPDL